MEPCICTTQHPELPIDSRQSLAQFIDVYPVAEKGQAAGRLAFQPRVKRQEFRTPHSFPRLTAPPRWPIFKDSSEQGYFAVKPPLKRRNNLPEETNEFPGNGVAKTRHRSRAKSELDSERILCDSPREGPFPRCARPSRWECERTAL